MGAEEITGGPEALPVQEAVKIIFPYGIGSNSLPSEVFPHLHVYRSGYIDQLGFTVMLRQIREESVHLQTFSEAAEHAPWKKKKKDCEPLIYHILFRKDQHDAKPYSPLIITVWFHNIQAEPVSC